MKTLRVLFVAALLCAATAALVEANPVTPRVDRREARQSVRIQQGVKSGELTPGEAAHLRAGQRHVHRMERRAKADGMAAGERDGEFIISV